MSSDAGDQALSVTTFENDFVEAVYAKISSVYDVFFGPTLHAGRLEAIRRLPIRPGDNVLEVGIGTGINAPLYPRDCLVTGIDFSTSMLEQASHRIAARGIRNVELMQMDAADLKFPDGSFDIVYAPYVISVVTDPVRVALEMHRVCRVGGHIVILNHFRSENWILSRAEELISPLTVHLGFRSDLNLRGFLAQANLNPISIEKVNIPRMWSLITCRKDKWNSDVCPVSSPTMHEREFFNETPETKSATLTCPRCRFQGEYGVRWIRRVRKERLPRGANERDRALFAKLRNYLVRVDDMVVCQKCRQRFEIPSHKNLAFF